MMEQHNQSSDRNRRIVRASLVGVAANFLLVVFKAMVGLMANSIAIVLDAVNNFSDILSSLVTIIGVRLANRAPDREHPMGHGRSEYLSTAVIAVIIMYIGFTALVESVQKIFHPAKVDYSFITILVVSVATIIKVALSIYVKKVGTKVKSDSLIGSGIDAMFDAVISFTTLIAAIIYMTSGVSIEPYLATGISVIIIRAGFKMLREAFSTILGERVDPDLAKRIKTEILNVKQVKGAYDLIVHDYGPDTIMASVNVEIPDDLTALQIDDISRRIGRRVYRKCHVHISSVGIYPVNAKGEGTDSIQNQVREIISKHEHVIQMHGLHVHQATKEISFDIVVDFALKDRQGYYRKIRNEVQDAFPDYIIDIALDSDISD